MATLTIVRPGEYTNRLRNIQLIADGKEPGRINNNETMSFELPEGNHVLQAKIDWCGSKKINVTLSAGKAKTFTLTSFAQHSILGPFAAIYYITFGCNEYIRLEEKLTTE